MAVASNCSNIPVPGLILSCCLLTGSFVEGSLIIGELQYYGYSIAVMTALLLALTQVSSNLVVTPVCIILCTYGIPYVDINTPSPADSGRKVGGERRIEAEARQA